MGWYAMLALLLAALLGLFGSGPLSHGTAGEPGSPIRLEYERFGRQERETTLRIHLQPGADRVRVWIDRTYLEAIEIKAISPPPERAEAGPHRVGYLFAIADATRPAVITFWVKPQRFGVLSGEVGLDDGTMLRFHQWIYP
ncbi:MAG: hypothetical protein IRY99_28130 [Isosphaeraceae bacterium]|nr:hypothetical protein [Isosphaeraceae bacterium]